VLAGCASATSSTPVRAGVGGSLADITSKVNLISQDECATKAAATVFPNCPRFITEIGNVANQVNGAAPGRPDAAALTAAASTVGNAVSRFIGDGCVASPSEPTPSAATCGPDLAAIQSGLRALRAAVDASAR
jgi:hypothetical protein